MVRRLFAKRGKATSASDYHPLRISNRDYSYNHLLQSLLFDGRSATDFCASFQRSFPFIFLPPKMVLSFILVQNRQGKTRLAKWYAPYTDEEKVKLKGEVSLLSHPKESTIPVSPWTIHL
jgi:hypothetical protein